MVGLASWGGANSAFCTRSSDSRSLLASNGSRSVIIRYSIDPTEKMSDRRSIASPRACSGDMYATLPLMTPAAVCSRLRWALAMPKSASLTSPSPLRSTLFGLMSRWTIPSGLPSRLLPWA